MVERPFRRGDNRPERAVILAQQIEHLLRLGGLGEGGKPAQVAEHDDDVAAMGFEDVLVAARDDQFGELRREKPLQFSHSLQFPELRRDPVLQLAVPRRDLVGARPQFAEQPRVLHRDDRLRREILQNGDLLVRKRLNLLAIGNYQAEQCVVLAQRHNQKRTNHIEAEPTQVAGEIRLVRCVLAQIGDTDKPLTAAKRTKEGGVCCCIYTQIASGI